MNKVRGGGTTNGHLKRNSLQIVISLRCSWCKNLYPEQSGDDQTEAMKMAFL